MLPVRLLFLAASPTSVERLQLDREAREIAEKIRLSDGRDFLEMISCWAVRPEDLLQHLNEHRPHIVHFSGHGSRTGEIFLEDEQRRPFAVNHSTLARLFEAMSDNIRLVVLNACYSAAQARAIVEFVDCAIGTTSEIEDTAAVAFAASFYRALGFGRSVAEALQQGKVTLDLLKVAPSSWPQLQTRQGVDPNRVFLIGERATAPRPLDIWRDPLSLPFYRKRDE